MSSYRGFCRALLGGIELLQPRIAGFANQEVQKQNAEHTVKMITHHKDPSYSSDEECSSKMNGNSKTLNNYLNYIKKC